MAAFRAYLPSAASQVLGAGPLERGTSLVFRSTQTKLANKQLALSLLDTLLVKLFPELKL